MYVDTYDNYKKVSEEWIEDCLKTYNRILIGEKSHWCREWDYMPIDETCSEFDCCICFNKVV